MIITFVILGNNSTGCLRLGMHSTFQNLQDATKTIKYVTILTPNETSVRRKVTSVTGSPTAGFFVSCKGTASFPVTDQFMEVVVELEENQCTIDLSQNLDKLLQA